ncbi:hypothetical protein BOX37_07680 [Nocardia mangyaensis]|uniref:Uncharacterized protein n=1 Tax=Nocardia mangyaensis TaxID=2213200 RepID=A0A1J0VPC0_9NOCA|nr:hypothetical protein BOX37_07680 [Nocardia mangyaensis]
MQHPSNGGGGATHLFGDGGERVSGLVLLDGSVNLGFREVLLLAHEDVVIGQDLEDAAFGQFVLLAELGRGGTTLVGGDQFGNLFGGEATVDAETTGWWSLRWRTLGS